MTVQAKFTICHTVPACKENEKGLLNTINSEFCLVIDSGYGRSLPSAAAAPDPSGSVVYLQILISIWDIGTTAPFGAAAAACIYGVHLFLGLFFVILRALHPPKIERQHRLSTVLWLSKHKHLDRVFCLCMYHPNRQMDY